MQAIPLEGKYLEKAVELYRQGWALSPSTVITIQPEQALAALTTPDAVFWVFEVEGEIVGLGGFEKIRPIDRVAEPYLSVLPRLQKKGLGWAISKFLWSRREVLNLRRIQTIVLEDSPTVKFLVKLGFKQEGVLEAMRLREGKPVDGLLFGWVRE